MASKHRNGETRTCPYCGQRSTFRERVQVPDDGIPAGAPEEKVKIFKAGWECENRKCSRRYDFV
jgi:DNA-directed RNA polymerase subunit RPC12/RpoP